MSYIVSYHCQSPQQFPTAATNIVRAIPPPLSAIMSDLRVLKEGQSTLREELGWVKKDLDGALMNNTDFKEDYDRFCGQIRAVEDAIVAKVPDEKEQDMEIVTLKKKIEHMEDILLKVCVYSIADYHS